MDTTLCIRPMPSRVPMVRDSGRVPAANDPDGDHDGFYQTRDEEELDELTPLVVVGCETSFVDRFSRPASRLGLVTCASRSAHRLQRY